MCAPIVWRAVLISLLWSSWLVAQSTPTSTTTCNLDDGRQVYVRYNPIPTNKEKIQNNKPWTPGGAPMTLFSEAQLTLGTSTIPIGAYTVYPIPAKDHWTLAVNKNVTPGAAYDEKQDIARAPMETAQVQNRRPSSRSPSPMWGRGARFASTSARPRRSQTSRRSDRALPGPFNALIFVRLLWGLRTSGAGARSGRPFGKLRAGSKHSLRSGLACVARAAPSG